MKGTLAKRRVHAVKIAEIRIRTLRYSYPPELVMHDARYTLTHREALILEVEADDGQVGLGEAVTFGGPPGGLEAVIRVELAPRLLGRNPLDHECLWADMYYGSLQHSRKGLVVVALSALDTAVWDLCARSLGVPLYQLIGGFRDRVPAYASGGFYMEGKGIDELAKEMAGYVARGFRAVKMKVGRLPVNKDVERVRAVRQAIGPDVRLMVDANRAYNHGDAIRMGRILETLDVTFFEEPIPPDDLDGYRKIGAKLDVTLAAGENEYGLFGFRDLVDTDGVGVVQPDVSWSGGITACLKIAAMAEARHIEITPHAFSSIINLASTLHLLGAVPNGGWLELDQSVNGLRTDLAEFPLELDAEGCVSIPHAPGTGLVLQPDALDAFTHVEESYEQRRR